MTTHNITFDPITLPTQGYRAACACPESECVLGSLPRRDQTYLSTTPEEGKIKAKFFEQPRVVIDILEWIANGMPTQARDAVTDLYCGDPQVWVKAITANGYTTTDKTHTTVATKTGSITTIDGSYNITPSFTIEDFLLSAAADSIRTRLQLWDYVEFTSGYFSGRVYKVKSINKTTGTFKLLGLASILVQNGDGIKIYRFAQNIPWSRIIPHVQYQTQAVLDTAINDVITSIVLVDASAVRIGDKGYIDREWVRVIGKNTNTIQVERAFTNPGTGESTTARAHGVGSVLQVDIGGCFNDFYDQDEWGEGWGHVCLQNQKDYYTRIADPTNPCTNTTCPNYVHQHALLRREEKFLHEMVNRWLYRESFEVDAYSSGTSCNIITLVYPKKTERKGPSLANLYGDPFIGLSNDPDGGARVVMGIPTALESLTKPYRIHFPLMGRYLATDISAYSPLQTGLFLRYYLSANGLNNRIKNGRVYELLGAASKRAFLDNELDPNYIVGTIPGWDNPVDSGTLILFDVVGELRNHLPLHGEMAQNVWDGNSV